MIAAALSLIITGSIWLAAAGVSEWLRNGGRV